MIINIIGMKQGLFLSIMLWVSCLIFLIPLKHRSYYRARIVVSFIVGAVLGIALLWVSSWNDWVGICLYFMATLLFILFCCDMSFFSSLYCGVWAFLSCQLTCELWFVLSSIIMDTIEVSAGLLLVYELLVFAIIYTALALTVARWMPENKQYRVGPRQLISALVLLVVFEILWRVLFKDLVHQRNTYTVTLLLAQIYCITMLYLQQTLFRKSAMKQEINTLNRLWFEQKQQYTIAKENIALINQKCHDLKHQVAAMRCIASKEDQEKYLCEIEDSIRIYDAIIQTGNEVLDTVLTEKSLLCDAKDIAVNCIADGNSLRFMDPVDIYIIFGNALDNAIERVSSIRNKNRRLIDVLVCTERQFLLIEITNPREGEEFVLSDDLPVSTKENDGYHGFGLKSIRHTVEKYGGHLLVKIEEHAFTLKALIPLAVE